MVRDRSRRARFDAIRAEKATAKVNARFRGIHLNDRTGRAGIGASLASALRTRRINDRASAKPIRQNRQFVRIGNRAKSLIQSGAQEINHQNGSQIMPAVGKIETLVAQRKIGNLLIAHGHGQPKPVVKRGIHDFVVRKAAVGIGHRDVADGAAPAFHERDHDLVRFQGLERQRKWVTAEAT